MGPVNAKQDDKTDVAMESVAGENNVMMDSDKEKSAEDDAVDAKEVKSGEEEMDELKPVPYDKMRTEQVYGGMDFN